MFCDVLDRKLALFDPKNIEKKNRNCVYSKGLDNCLVKNLKFVYCVSLGKFGLEKVFGCFLDRKLVFLDHKNLDIKKSQNLHFFKGVNTWFW